MNYRRSLIILDAAIAPAALKKGQPEQDTATAPARVVPRVRTSAADPCPKWQAARRSSAPETAEFLPAPAIQAE